MTVANPTQRITPSQPSYAGAAVDVRVRDAQALDCAIRKIVRTGFHAEWTEHDRLIVAELTDLRNRMIEALTAMSLT